jgi:chitin disaccharide deacetylase
MVAWPAAGEAAAYGRRQPSLAIGLHIDLGEWIYQHGEWTALYERVDRTDSAAVTREVQAQVDRFCDVVGRFPTHIDSHQHVHCREPVRSIVIGIAAELRAPLRHVTPAVRYCGDFYGQTAQGEPVRDRVAASALVALLHRLPDGLTELGCHPGYADDVESMYGVERTLEVDALCDPRVREALDRADIRLVSFASLEVS